MEQLFENEERPLYGAGVARRQNRTTRLPQDATRRST